MIIELIENEVGFRNLLKMYDIKFMHPPTSYPAIVAHHSSDYNNPQYTYLQGEELFKVVAKIKKARRSKPPGV